ncbi:PRADC1-like protein [Artemia franciscana]|uniref:PA domain-containing protein n=1 Tax=Artemia franciscana TaxID=6661 RepID=A0AA88HIM0_ARTSF|nr:hypothetical protein QYM36_013380 [Artemia franciscana]KAK2709682.1 hypothetical protein QYM36_013380 [Artemia franciscana]KAK2709683.1 hypothetical protein QYM36_013380 [Artemia franciscana]
MLRIYQTTLELKSLLSLLSFIFMLLNTGIMCGVNNLHMMDGTNIAEIAGQDVFFEIVEPEAISYTFRSRPAKGFAGNFNYTIFRASLTPVNPVCGCSRYINEDEVEGSIALIERGECSFVTKAVRAKQSGAIAAIIMDNDFTNDDHLVDMVDDGTGREVDIPVSFISRKDGVMIKRTLERLQLLHATINIPVNITKYGTKVRFSPWLVW